MTSKEAFELLKRYEAELSITKKTEVSYDDVISARYEIGKLVERDTPMIPIYKSIELICPKCRERQHTNTARFCSECGQKLDWSEWNE